MRPDERDLTREANGRNRKINVCRVRETLSLLVYESPPSSMNGLISLGHEQVTIMIKSLARDRETGLKSRRAQILHICRSSLYLVLHST